MGLTRGRLVRSKKFRVLTRAMAVQALVRLMNGPWYWRARELARAWWATVYPFLCPWRRGAACPECSAPVWHRSWHGVPQTRRTCPPRCNLGLGAPTESDWRTPYQPHQSWEDFEPL